MIFQKRISEKNEVDKNPTLTLKKKREGFADSPLRERK